MLDGLAAAAELEQPGADRGIVDLGQIAAQLLVSDAGGGGDGAQLIAEEPLVARPGIGRLGEAHILAGSQPLHGAGLEAGLDDTVLVRLVPERGGIAEALAHRLVMRPAVDLVVAERRVGPADEDREVTALGPGARPDGVALPALDGEVAGLEIEEEGGGGL